MKKILVRFSLLGLIFGAYLQADSVDQSELINQPDVGFVLEDETKSWSEEIWTMIRNILVCPDSELDQAVRSLFGKIDKQKLCSYKEILSNAPMLQDLFTKNTGESVSLERSEKIVEILASMMKD